MSRPAEPVRCKWRLPQPARSACHDTEWGVPVHDDRKHFEFLILDAPIVNHWTGLAEFPARTAQSDAMSKDLKRRGFKFVGSTICYACMQAAGLVNDHSRACFTRAAAPRPRRPATNAPRRRGSPRGSG